MIRLGKALFGFTLLHRLPGLLPVLLHGGLAHFSSSSSPPFSSLLLPEPHTQSREATGEEGRAWENFFERVGGTFSHATVLAFAGGSPTHAGGLILFLLGGGGGGGVGKPIRSFIVVNRRVKQIACRLVGFMRPAA